MADRQIKDKGQAVTITKQTPGSYNTSTGVATVTTSAQYSYGVVFPVNDRNIDGTLIKQGDKRLLLSVLNTAGAALTAPSINDTVTVGSVTYTITDIKPLAPAGTVLYYDCNIRGIG